MKPVVLIVIISLSILTIMLLFPVISQRGFEFDAHGHYTAPDGTLHRESISERNFFALLLSALLLFVTSLYYFIRQKSSTRK